MIAIPTKKPRRIDGSAMAFWLTAAMYIVSIGLVIGQVAAAIFGG